jgi:hypothetical protein
MWLKMIPGATCDFARKRAAVCGWRSSETSRSGAPPQKITRAELPFALSTEMYQPDPSPPDPSPDPLGAKPLGAQPVGTDPAPIQTAFPVPLITLDPHFSIWSPSDRLAESDTLHPSGAPSPLCAMVRVDGQAYRLLGAAPGAIPAAAQVGLDVRPTRTTATFVAGGVQIRLSFVSPLLPGEPDVWARPLVYVVVEATVAEDAAHEISFYFDAGGELVVHDRSQEVEWARWKAEELDLVSIGSVDQRVLQTVSGGRIDWGYLYLTAPTGRLTAGPAPSARASFARGAQPTGTSVVRGSVREFSPSLTCVIQLGRVRDRTVQRHLLLAHDDEWSADLSGERLRPYWRRNGTGIEEMFAQAEHEFVAVDARCLNWDRRLMREIATTPDDPDFRAFSLSYRRCLSRRKLAATGDGQLHVVQPAGAEGPVGAKAPAECDEAELMSLSLLQPFKPLLMPRRWG